MIYLYETPGLLAVCTIFQRGHPFLNHRNPYKVSHPAYYSLLSIGIDQTTVVEIEWFWEVRCADLLTGTIRNVNCEATLVT